MTQIAPIWLSVLSCLKTTLLVICSSSIELSKRLFFDKFCFGYFCKFMLAYQAYAKNVSYYFHDMKCPCFCKAILYV